LLVRADPVVGIVCQPDRPRGRGLVVEPPAVKELARRRGLRMVLRPPRRALRVLQSARARDPAFLGTLRALAPDVIVVAAYGRILPRSILDLPPRGCLHVHAAILPPHRRAPPIQP